VTGPLQRLRERVDIKPAHHKTRPLLTGAIVIAVALFAVIGAATRTIPLWPKGGHKVYAEFKIANQVSNRTVVRVNGVDVGRVEKVEAGSDPSRTSKVVMRIKEDNINLRSDARAEIRWRTLFGGLMYIDLHPGSPSAPPLKGAIPATRTDNQIELDQVLQPYDGTTAQAQRDVLKGLRDTLNDPEGIKTTINTLAPTLETVTQGLTPLRGRESDDLRKLVAATSRVVKGLDDTAALQGLVGGGNRTLGVTAQRREDVGKFIELSPPSLSETFTTMKRLRTTLDHLDPLAAELRPGARALAPAARATTPAVTQLRAALREARPLLRSARPTFEALARASVTGVPLMKDLTPTFDRLDSELLPWLNKKDDSTRMKVYEMIGPFWSTLAGAASEYDDEGYRIRFTVPPSTNSVGNLPISLLQRSCAQSGVNDTRCKSLATGLGRLWFQGKKAKR
jgi:ABC-type transporter Mla subunit MlaD